MGEIKSDQKVRCIDSRFIDEETNPFKKSELTLPVEGKSYIVREVVRTPYGKGIRLKEIENKKYYFDNIKRFEEPIFSIDRFVKIED